MRCVEGAEGAQRGDSALAMRAALETRYGRGRMLAIGGEGGIGAVLGPLLVGQLAGSTAMP